MSGTLRRHAALRRELAPVGRAVRASSGGHGIAQAIQLGGKEMSYNNYVDADAALRAAFDFEEPAVAIIKHANPCGIAIAPSTGSGDRRIAEAHTPAPTPATRCRPTAA